MRRKVAVEGYTSAVNASVISLSMERVRQKVMNIMDDGLGKDLMDAGRFCFSCEQIFANRKCLEEHVCSSASYICSCGTEFTEYKDMQEHSSTHEPGHQVLDHETIKKRRIEKRMEEEEQLKRLQTGEVVWKTPRTDNTPPLTLPAESMWQAPITSSFMPQVPMRSAQISQVPEFRSLSQASSPPNPAPSPSDMQKIFAGVGAPTVDLWTLYQPVVILETPHKYNKKKSYACGKCGQSFSTKTSLISHYSSHSTDKVSGCIGCGLLLSSKKVVPRFHICNSPSSATKFRLITAKPPVIMTKRRGEAVTVRSQELKCENLTAVIKGTQAPHVTSALHLKNQNVRTFSKSNQGPHITSSLQLKSKNLGLPKPHLTVALPSKSPITYSKSSQALQVTSGQMKTPLNSASVAQGKQIQTSSPSAGFTCRVCHIPFETAQLLQRHKCIKAQEFMAQRARGGKQHCKLKRVTPVVAGPNLAQMNGERKFGVTATGNIKKKQVLAVHMDKVQGSVPVNGKTGANLDDDCYIVESGPDKPAEMIYQVTSSVPIKI